MDNSYFGKYGGTFIPETLSFALEELENLYKQIKNDNSFKTTLGNCIIKKVNNTIIVSKEH